MYNNNKKTTVKTTTYNSCNGRPSMVCTENGEILPLIKASPSEQIENNLARLITSST